MKRRVLCVVMVVAMALCLAACGGAGPQNAKITSAWSIVEMTVNGKSMTYDDSNRDAKAPQFSCTDGTNFTFTNNGKAHTGTLENQVKNTSCITVIRAKRWKLRFRKTDDDRDFRERQHASGV